MTFHLREAYVYKESYIPTGEVSRSKPTPEDFQKDGRVPQGPNQEGLKPMLEAVLKGRITV